MSTRPDVLPAATQRPESQMPVRAPGSIRRSSHIGVQASPKTSDILVHGAVRDVVTDMQGRGRVVGAATLDCVVGPDRSVSSIASDPPTPALSELVGRVAHRGWRAAAREVVEADSPLSSLLDDVPIALLLSSYGALRQGALDLPATQPLLLRMRNLCAGWASDATPMRIIDTGAPMPLPGVVPVPDSNGSDPLATEPRSPVVPGEVRRVRRLDVLPGETVTVHASFRDTWCDPAGVEGVLHEYVLTATLDAGARVSSIEAEPRVLPYAECSFAAASPQRLVGQPIESVAADVKENAGTSTCTHLDDLLRTLSVVPSLLAALNEQWRSG